MRHPAAVSRRRPGAAATAAAGVALAAVVLSGCGDSTAVVDAGATAGAPPLPVTLWSVAPKPTASAGHEALPPYRPDPLPGLTLPPGGSLRDVSAAEVVAKDPNMDAELKRSAERCAPGSGCGLRRPELRDLTGDGKPELLVVVDPDPRLQPTGDSGPELDTQLYVYRSEAGRLFQVLGLALQDNTQVDLQERDLVIRRTADQGWPGSLRQVTTDRYRWNSQLRQLELNSTVTAPVPGTPSPGNSSAPPPKKPFPPSPKAAPNTP